MSQIQLHAYTMMGRLVWSVCVIDGESDGPVVTALVSGDEPIPGWVGEDSRDVAWLACHSAGAALARLAGS